MNLRNWRCINIQKIEEPDILKVMLGAQSISLVIIVKNEMRWLKEFFEAIEGCFDEVIMVDSGSTDGSKEFAQSQGAKVFEFKWVNDFSEARNFGISKASSDWIFTMDPDERIAKKDLLALRNYTKDQSVDAYSAWVRNYVDDESIAGLRYCAGEYREFEKDYRYYTLAKRVRFFRRRPEIQYVGRVHELVEPTIRGAIRKLPFPVHHYGLLKSEIEFKKKDQLYRQLLEEKLEDDPTSARARVEVLFQYTRLEQWEKVIEEYEKLLEMRLTHPMVISQVSWAYHKLGQHERGIQVAREGLRQFPLDFDLLFNLATIYFGLKDFHRAEPMYLQAYQVNPKALESLRNASFSALCKGDVPRAYELCQSILLKDPRHQEARIDEIIMLGILGQKAVAKERADDLSRQGCDHPRFLRTVEKLNFQ